MLTMTELNTLYVEKLQATGSHDAALLKVCWAAYQQGHADAVAGRPEQMLEDDGWWIDWDGEACPVSPETLVRIRQRDGLIGTGLAGMFIWSHANRPSDIVAYHVVQS